jgi:hypothetical protein
MHRILVWMRTKWPDSLSFFKHWIFVL